MATKEFKLNELLDFLPKSHRKAGDGLESGTCPFFTSSQQQTKWFDEADYKIEAIILGTGGAPSVHCAKNFSTSADVFVLASKSNTISVKYISYFLRSDKDILERGFKGAGLKHLSRDYTLKIQIPLPVDNKGNPDIKEQERMVALLEEAEELKKKRAEADQKMITVIPALFSKMFGDPISNPKNWPIHKLADVCDGKSGIKAGPFGSSLKKNCYTTEGPRVYGQEQVIAGDFTIGDYHISDEKFIEMSTYNVIPGDLLISLVGTIGKVVIVPEGVECGIINPRLIRIRTRTEMINQSYLAQVLTSPSVVQFFSNIATGITMGVLNAGLLKRLNVPVPPLPLQNEFAERVKEILVFKEKQKDSTENINRLFPSLLSRAFTS